MGWLEGLAGDVDTLKVEMDEVYDLLELRAALVSYKAVILLDVTKRIKELEERVSALEEAQKGPDVAEKAE